MSNAAKRIPRVVREKIELAEQRRQEVVGRLDAWAEEKLPENIVRPLKEADGVSVDVIKTAASAAGEELMSYLRNRLTVLRGGKSEEASQSADLKTTPSAEVEVVKKAPATPAKKKARARPAAKKPAAKGANTKTKAATRKTPAKSQNRTTAAPKKTTTTKAKTSSTRRPSKKTSPTK